MDSTAIIIVTPDNWPVALTVFVGLIVIRILLYASRNSDRQAGVARDAAISPAAQAILDGWRDDHFAAERAGLPCPVRDCYHCYVGARPIPSARPCTCSPYQACTCPVGATH